MTGQKSYQEPRVFNRHDLVEAAQILMITALLGASIGFLIVGIPTAVFCGIKASKDFLQASAFGALSGMTGAVFEVALGKVRFRGAYFGALMGILALVPYLADTSSSIDWGWSLLYLFLGIPFLLLLCSPGVLTAWAVAHCTRPAVSTIFSRLFNPLRHWIERSLFYRIPLRFRLMIALAEMAVVILLLSKLLRHLLP